MTAKIGLYYPYIEFQDDSWVKLAALYWDKLGRIVPSEYKPHDSNTVRQLREELDFIVNFTPTSEDTNSIAKLYIEMLNMHEKEIVALYSILPQRKVNTKKEKIEIHDVKEEYKSLIRDKNREEVKKLKKLLEETNAKKRKAEERKLIEEGLISYEPIAVSKTGQLTGTFEGLMLARIENFEKQDDRVREFQEQEESKKWLGPSLRMHPKFAFIYMHVLAEQMAFSRQLYPVTDNMPDFLATSQLGHRKYTVENLAELLLTHGNLQSHVVNSSITGDDVEVQTAIIALQSILPANLEEVPTKKIIKLRNEYRNELTNFQTSIHDFTSGLEYLQAIHDPLALKAHLEVEYAKKFKPQIDDLKKYLKSLGIGTLAGTINIRVALPPILASTGAYLSQAHIGPINPIIIGAGAIAFSVFPVFRKKQEEASKVIRSSPAAYLIYAKESLNPTNAITRVTQHVRQMVFHI